MHRDTPMAALINAACARLGVNQTTLAERMGIGRVQLSNLKKQGGKGTKRPSSLSIHRYATILGVTEQTIESAMKGIFTPGHPQPDKGEPCDQGTAGDRSVEAAYRRLIWLRDHHRGIFFRVIQYIEDRCLEINRHGEKHGEP